MNSYRDYMDRQTVSPELHQKLIDLEKGAKQSKKRTARWQPAAAMAACLCVILGLGWFGRQAVSGGSSSQTSMDAAATAQEAGAVAFETEDSASDMALESNVSTETADTTAKTADTAEDETANFPEENEEFLVLPEAFDDQWAEKELPEAVVLPGWLPEGYALTEFTMLETLEDGYSLTWTGEDGCRIIMSWGPGGLETADVLFPVYEAGTADWETISADLENQTGEIGFFLTYGDCWRCFTTTGDPWVLWQVAESIP